MRQTIFDRHPHSMLTMGLTSARNALGALFVFLMAASVISGIDTSIVNTVLPEISMDLDMDVSYSSMVTIAYVTPVAALLLPLTKVADRRGIRRIFAVGTLVFMAASVCCAISWSGESLIAFRLIQGIGAAMVVSTTPLMVVRLFPDTHHGRGMGAIAAGNGLASIAGPPLGGFVADLLSWQWVFLINVPICLALLVASQRLLPEEPTHPDSADLPDGASVALLVAGASAGMVSLYLFIDTHQDWMWLVATMIVAVLLISLAFIRSARAGKPLLDLELLMTRRFLAVTLIFLLSTMMGAGTMYLLPYYLSIEEGMTSAAIGLLMGMASLVTVASTVPTGWWCDHRGCYAPAGLALGLRVLFSLMFAAIDPSLGMVYLVFAVLTLGLSFGISGTSQSARLIEESPRKFVAEAGSVAMLVNYVGYALGIAMFALIFMAVTGVHSDPSMTDAPTFLEGFQGACLVGAAVAAVALTLSLAIRPEKVEVQRDG